ncbi:hypothetical protein [Roseobacter sinensis]|uniref:Uncharacterized protein n=1 Tax=Roseobacter sinensis TaxID=2931391 RepID=A0ABT3BFX2_9RHOB|nr:hypothetical protein [Roseobacter sp. WL0113]MCV3272485.1 hypothetical protein [Roseobacter sp. WL0113]
MTSRLTLHLRRAFWAWFLPDIQDDSLRYARDPLSHPDIARMSERERADLPFCPARVRSE